MKRKCLVGVAVVFGMLAVAQVQPWAFAIKPLGPTVGEQHERLRVEWRGLMDEGRELRLLTFKRLGINHPSLNELAQHNPMIADYVGRLNDFNGRRDDFVKKHPQYAW